MIILAWCQKSAISNYLIQTLRKWANFQGNPLPLIHFNHILFGSERADIRERIYQLYFVQKLCKIIFDSKWPKEIKCLRNSRTDESTKLGKTFLKPVVLLFPISSQCQLVSENHLLITASPPLLSPTHLFDQPSSTIWHHPHHATSDMKWLPCSIWQKISCIWRPAIVTALLYTLINHKYHHVVSMAENYVFILDTKTSDHRMTILLKDLKALP